ncbi:hypothetical protein CF326_g6204 [Tilletia indica]|nr:hypothetical protein CF326_g6204 [Tilletia indica]
MNAQQITIHNHGTVTVTSPGTPTTPLSNGSNKKTASSTTSRLKGQRSWTKHYADLIHDARSRVDDIIEEVVSQSGQTSSSVREQCLLRTRTRRKDHDWNKLQTYMGSKGHFPGGRFPPLPEREAGEKWNEYVKQRLSPAYKKLRTEDATRYTELVTVLENAVKEGVPKLTVTSSVAAMNKEERRLRDVAFGLENNEGIAAVVLMTHPDPSVQPRVVATEYGLERMANAMVYRQPHDTFNSLAMRFAAAVTTKPPPSYLYVPPSKSNSHVEADTVANPDAASAAGLSKLVEADTVANPDAASAAGLSKLVEAETRAAPPTQAFNPPSPPPHGTLPASASLSTERVDRSPQPPPPQAFNPQVPPPRGTLPASASLSTERVDRGAPTGSSKPQPHFRAFMCSKERLPVPHSVRVPYVARQLRECLSDIILTLGEDIYDRWLKDTDSLGTMPYKSLFTLIKSYGMYVDGWPSEAHNLLTEPCCFPSVEPGALEVMSGGLRDTSHWTEAHVTAIAASLASRTLDVAFVPGAARIDPRLLM